MIVKYLKSVNFGYDAEQSKTLGIRKGVGKDAPIVMLSRTEMFSLARFILRVAQKPNRRKK